MSKMGKERMKWSIWNCLSEKKDKIAYSVVSPIHKEAKHVRKGRRDAVGSDLFLYSERVSSFSLDYRAIRPSAVFGIRRKAALREEGFAWVLDLGSFLKIREVGVSPYLSFILYLSTLLMFELNEVVRGCLIGPKSWDRIVIIFETSNGHPVQFTDCL